MDCSIGELGALQSRPSLREDIIKGLIVPATIVGLAAYAVCRLAPKNPNYQPLIEQE